MSENIIHTNLPASRDRVIVTVAFAYGFLDESDASFGMGHLAEHCICAQLKHDGRFQDAWGHIDDRSLVINISLNGAECEKILEKGVLKTVSEIAQSISSATLKTEKLRICAEIDERYNSTIPLISEYVKGTLITGPKRLARARTSQLKTLKKASMKSLSKAFGAILSSPHRIFVGGPGTTSAAQPLSPRLDVTFSEKKNFRLRPSKTEGAFIIAFRISGMEVSFENALVTGFAAGAIYEAFRDIARAHGAHEPYYEIRIEREYGIVWFGLHSRAKISPEIGAAFFAAADSALNAHDLDAKLKAYKRDKIAEMKADWADPVERQDWIVEDSIEGRAISDVSAALDSVKGITVEKVGAVARKVFSSEKGYVFE